MGNQQQPGRSRRRLFVDDVIAAAVEVITTDGVDGLTIRSVAARLGSSPMALYRHVTDRDELVALAVDRTAAGVELPPDPDRDEPRQWLLGAVEEARRWLLRAPGSAEYLLMHGPTGPYTLAFMSAVCRVIRRTGRDARDTAWAYDWLLTTVAVYVTKEERLSAAPRPADLTGVLSERTLRYVADDAGLLDVVMSFDGDVESAFRRATTNVIDALLTGG